MPSFSLPAAPAAPSRPLLLLLLLLLLPPPCSPPPAALTACARRRRRRPRPTCRRAASLYSAQRVRRHTFALHILETIAAQLALRRTDGCALRRRAARRPRPASAGCRRCRPTPRCRAGLTAVKRQRQTSRFDTFGSSPWGSKVVSLFNEHDVNCSIHKACTSLSSSSSPPVIQHFVWVEHAVLIASGRHAESCAETP